MEFYSKKLDKKIDLKTIATEDGLPLVDSRNLWEFMDNDESVRAKGFSVVVDHQGIKASANLDSVIIFGYAVDNEFTYSLECGEARAESLNCDISKAYPAKMALKRLKDVCAINWLQLEGADGKRIYSSDEVMIQNNFNDTIPGDEVPTVVKTTASDEELSALINGAEAVQQDISEETTVNDLDPELADVINAAFKTTPEPVSEEIPEIPAEAAEGATKPSEEIEELLSEKFKVRGTQYTYSDVCDKKENESLLKWFLATKFTAGYYGEIQNNIRKILESRGQKV